MFTLCKECRKSLVHTDSLDFSIVIAQHIKAEHPRLYHDAHEIAVTIIKAKIHLAAITGTSDEDAFREMRFSN
jgi:hypothetical protein